MSNRPNDLEEIFPVLKSVGTFREVIEKKGRFPGGKNHMNQY